MMHRLLGLAAAGMILVAGIASTLPVRSSHRQDPEPDPVPKELREHVKNTYKSEAMKEGLASSFRRVYSGDGKIEIEGMDFILDLRDTKITKWLVEHYEPVTGLVDWIQERKDLPTYVLPLGQALLALAPTDRFHVGGAESDPKLRVMIFVPLLLRGLGLDPQARPKDGLRATVTPWVRERFEEALKRENLTPEAKRWLAYCKEAVLSDGQK